MTFDLNGGSGTAATGLIATYDADMPTYDQSAPTKTGYTLDGWYTATVTNGNITAWGTKYYNADLTSARTWNVNTTSGTTLYAKWTLNKYNVKKTETGGTGTVTIGSTTVTTTDQEVDYGTDYTITVTAPSGKNVSAITGATGFTGIGTGTATLTGYTLSDDLNLEITYVSATSPGITVEVDESSGNIGDSFVVTATKTHPSGSAGAITYSVTKDGSAATADTDYTVSTSGTSPMTITIVPLKAGEFEVTAGYTDTGNPSNSARFTVNPPTISVGNNSTVKVGGTYTVSATTTNPSNSSSLPSGWTITYTRKSGSTASISGTTITADNYGSATTFTASLKYNNVEKASCDFTVTPVTPTVSFSDYSSIGIGETSANGSVTATNCESLTKSFSITSGSDYATIDASSGTVTGVKPGTATVTVYYKKGSTTIISDTATVEVTAPTVTITSADTALVDSTTNFAATSSGATTNPSYSWSITNGSGTGEVVGNGQQLKALTPGTLTVNVSATYNASYTATTTQTFTITAPTVSMADQTVAKGDAVTFSATTSNPSGLTIAYSLKSAVTGVSISGATVSVADDCSASSATIVASAKNSAGTEVATEEATLTIEDPTLTITDTANASTKYLTVGTNYEKALTNNFGGSYTVDSSNTSVATVSESSGTLTVVPVAKGTATITVTATKGGNAAQSPSSLINKLALAATGAEVGDSLIGTGITASQTFTVNVAAADTDVVVYLNDFTYNNGDGWGTAYIHAWGDSGDLATRQAMTKIGTNEYGRSVYAYKFSAADWANVKHIVFLHSNADSAWNDQWEHTEDKFNGTHADTRGFYLQSTSNGSARELGTYTPAINVPQVVIDDASTPLGVNYTLTATKVNEATVGKYKWASATTSVATVTADTNTTASTTVTPVDAGTSEITVQAFAANPTNWNLTYSDTTLPFIGSTDTATITVTADPRTVTFANKASNNGTDYDTLTATGAGTVTAVDGDNNAVTSGSTVAHGTNVTFTAAANAGYKHVGWRIVVGETTTTSTDSTLTQRISANTTVYALFDKGVNVTFNDSSTFSSTTLKVATFTYDGAVPVAPADPSHDGYTFTGWSADGGTTTYTTANLPVLSNPTAAITYVAQYTHIDYSVSGSVKVTTDGTTYTTSSDAGTLAITNTDGSAISDPSHLTYDDKVKIVATEKPGYTFVGIYRVRTGGTEELVTTASGTTEVDGQTVATATCNEYTLNTDSEPAYVFEARFKKQLYITLYNSYEYKNNKWVFVAAPPKKVEIYANSSATTALRTYTYSSGTAEQRGEEHIKTETGTYYEGNKLLVYPGEKIVLTYAGLASSDFIKGAFYNNSLRYTVETEGDNYYVNRSHENQNGTPDGDGNYEHGDDDFGSEDRPYTFTTDTTLYAYSSYYTNYYGQDKSNTIFTNQPSYAATINQNNHTITIASAASDYLNVDIELSNKYQIHINGDNWDGLTIENMNDEGYYYENEPFNAAFKISLDNITDTTGTYSWNALGAEVSMDPDHPEPPSGLAVTAKKSDGSDASTVGEISYFLVSGNMTSADLYITLPLVKTYKMRLANIVVADAAQHRTMITEGNSSTDTTNYVGNITAVPKKGETTGSDISSDGTYYTWNAQDGNSSNTHNRPEYVRAFTESSENKKLNGGVNRGGSDVEDGYSVTYTYTPTDSFGVDYSFVGWFEGSFDGTDKFTVDYSKKLSGKTSFTYTPTKNTVIIAVATRDLYLGGNFTSDGTYTTTSANQTWSSGRIMMEFDPTYDKGDGDATHKGRYYYTFDTVTANTEYKFRAYDKVAGNSDTDSLNVWNTWTGTESYGEDNDDILFAREKYSGGSVGGFMYKTNTESATIANNTKTSTKNHDSLGYAAPVTVYFYAYDGGITVKSTYQWSRAYVSEGRGIDATAVEEGDSNSDNTTFNTPTATVNNKTVNNQDVVVTTEASKYGNGGKYEKIYECLVKEKDGQIVVNAKPNDANLELDAFLVYNIETKASEAVKTFTTSGSGADITYTGNITIPNNSKIYVVPIYKFTQAFITAQNLETHMVYVRAAEIDKDDWGGLVSMYSWGTDARYDSGRWPGQLMVPSDDGQSFYAPLTFMKNGLAGVTFNNYAQVWGSNYINFVGTYKDNGVSDVDYSSYTGTSTHYIHQVFDYREPISIIDNINEKNPSVYDSEDMDMVFALKPGNKTAATVGNGAYNASFNYEYLSDSSGKYRVDLNGNKISTNPTATYYVVCNYTENYASGGSESYDFKEGTRDGTSTHNRYSIDWNVYDINGTKITGATKLSATYTDVYKSEMLTDIAKLLIDQDYPVSGKAVKIAYENPKISSSDNTEAVRYSGQWYADGINTLIEGNVRVGIYSDGAWLPSDSNAPGYATATVSIADADSTIGEGTSTETGCSGASLAKVTKTHATNGKVSFTVNTTNNFLGWYRDDGEGGYEPVGSNYKNQTITPTFNNDITYYAFYSASASYRFRYKGRFDSPADNNQWHYYTAKGSDLTDAELAANGTLDPATRSYDVQSKLAKITDIRVFNHTLTYELNSADTSSPYMITYTAGDTVDEYTLTVKAYNSSGSLEKIGSVTGTWSTPLDVTTHADLGNGNSLVTNKPSGKKDKVFIGWKKSGTDDSAIISTQANFGYSITQNTTIEPVFGDARITAETWSAGIDKNVVTQELTNATTGKIYNDTLVNFRYAKATGEQFDIENNKCGVVILFQDEASKDTYGNAFTTMTDEIAEGFAKKMIDKEIPSDKNTIAAKLSATTYGTAYAYRIEATSLSRLNRADLYMSVDYAKYSGGNYKVIAYTKIGDDYTYSAVITDTFTMGQRFPKP
ncbi:MAG: InlB B-repeat-containing protein [Ruminococcus sp.]|nr:InlB B-repeat-containing protein [Ruminococcus sp.]